MFLNIRKCMVLLMHVRNYNQSTTTAVDVSGTWLLAPYLDKYGEADPTLRRRLPLFLNQRRYDNLARIPWLQHSIPTAIARRLEGEVSNGGWETL